jgi:peptidoglycan/LPS O-acetylase OafA/YrhL
LGVCILAPLFKPTAPFTFPAFALLTGITVDRLASGRWQLPSRGLLRIGWSHLGFLGVVSYSFYLFHQPVVFWVGQGIDAFLPQDFRHPLVRYVVCCSAYPAILGLAYLLYRYVERPSIALGKRAASFLL